MSCESRDTSDGQETDATATVDALKSWVRAFSQARDWEQFHNPKDLALALVCEVGESLREKLVIADRKYPVEQAFGRPDKYTAYQAKMDRPDGETEGR
jgi:hypothetical protein